MLDELLPVHLIQSRNPDEVLLGLHQTAPQCLVLPSQRVQDHVRSGIPIASIEELRELRAVGSCAMGRGAAPIDMRGPRLLLLLLLLLR